MVQLRGENLKEKVLIWNLICSLLENLLMIAGIVYSAVIFKRAALLWFLLLPVANSVNVRFTNDGVKNEESNE